MIEIGISNYRRSKHQLFFEFYADDLSFTNAYWYEDVDLIVLEEQYGIEQMERVYFHIAVFELNKLGSLHPQTISLGPFQKYYTKSFENFWREIFIKVWAQWRYENNFPDYDGPKFKGTDNFQNNSFHRIPHTPGPINILAFCGGGKDSLVSVKLLEELELPYATFGYSHSIYGNANHQHDLITKLCADTQTQKHHRQWIFGDFMDSPVLELHPKLNIETLTAAETPSSIFAVLPLILAQGYQYIVLAHEKSADEGNLIWDATGEEVNHQWGKSTEAEVLINTYLKEHLINNFEYFSLLKPINDVLIFNILRAHEAHVENTHSCNLRKPWCYRCPKCAYVLLNYYAYLSKTSVDQVITEKGLNIFDLEVNQITFRELVGLEDKKPFECVGQFDEAKLAFVLCQMKGISGQAIETILSDISTEDLDQIVETFTAISAENILIPEMIWKKLEPVLLKYQKNARKYVRNILKITPQSST